VLLVSEAQHLGLAFKHYQPHLVATLRSTRKVCGFISTCHTSYRLKNKLENRALQPRPLANRPKSSGKAMGEWRAQRLNGWPDTARGKQAHRTTTACYVEVDITSNCPIPPSLTIEGAAI